MWPAVQTFKPSTTSSAGAGSAPTRPSSSTSTTRPSATSSDGRRSRPAPTSTPPCRRRPKAFPAWRDTPVNARAQVLYRFKALLEAALRGDGAHRHHRARQDARRGARQRPARHRVRRGGVRRAVADAGLRPRGHLARDRLPRRAPAARRLRRDRAVQLSGDGADVVPAVRGRHRQHLHPEAVGAGAAVAAQDGGPARAVRPAAGRRQPRQRRPRRRRTRSAITRAFAPCRSSARRRSRKHVYQRGDARRQARAGARRREELRRRHAGRELRSVDRHHHRIVLRLRGRAMPGRQHARAGRRARTPRRAIGWSSRRGR